MSSTQPTSSTPPTSRERPTSGEQPTSRRQPLFTRIAAFVVRRRRRILVLSGLFVVVAGVVGTGVFSRLDVGGFEDPGSESLAAAEAAAGEFDSGRPNIVFLVEAADGDVRSESARAGGAAVEEILASDERVEEVVSYWSLGEVAPLASSDGDTALVLARVGGSDNERLEAAEELRAEAESVTDGVTVAAAGELPANQAVTETIEGDLARAEAIAVPITLVLLFLVFAGLVAAGLPLLMGIVAVLGTFVTLWAIAAVTDVSIFSINLVTAMGLGLAIDYSLFMVSRFREELARRPRDGRPEADRTLVDAAVVRTVETAGRTVAFSALTVGVSLSALLVFPMYFLRSFAYAGIGVTLVAMLASTLTLPAILATLGRRVDALQLPRARRRLDARASRPTEGFWYRTAIFAQRHAVAVALGVVAFLVLLGLPFLGVAFGVPDERVLPADDPTRVATERLRTEFDSAEADAFPVVLRNGSDASVVPSDTTIDEWAVRASGLDSVARVDAPTGRYVEGQLVLPPDDSLAGRRSQDAALLTVVPAVDPVSADGEELVADLRDISGPTALVGGTSASYVDTKAAIAERLPWALGLIALTTFVLLFLMFGSVVVPLKAIVLNILSLSATFGAMVWVFQWGNGAELLGFTATGLTDLTTPILMFCIAFGLSMDYEVFLLSRIAEEHRRGADNTTAVAMGLQRTGGIVTAAALLLSVTFLAFATSSITFIKLFGLGLALAVLMDASIVRALLVPAFMRLAGDANWWAPRWMRRIHDRIGISEAEDRDDMGDDLVVSTPEVLVDTVGEDRVPVTTGAQPVAIE